MQGVLSVHSARVGPGPLSREFLGIAEQIRAVIEKRPPRAGAGGLDQWLELPSQEVAFQMVDGRVHHQGLQLQVGDVLFKTKGAVGFDDSLALLAEVPIRDQWVADDRYLSALRGQTIQLPVQGTLGRPQVDGQALAQLTRQAVGGAATRLLEQELNRGLERLLRPQNRQ
jgi:hypothetical protein